jgi:hypothetical protein
LVEEKNSESTLPFLRRLSRIRYIPCFDVHWQYQVCMNGESKLKANVRQLSEILSKNRKRFQ